MNKIDLYLHRFRIFYFSLFHFKIFKISNWNQNKEVEIKNCNCATDSRLCGKKK